MLYLNSNTPSYDAENRMTSLVANGGGSESILYDAMGRRVQKSYGGNTTVYVYDNFGKLSSEYVNGAWSRDYIADGSGRLIATENSSGLCTTCYFGTDHLGSVRIVMDQNANVVARHDYLPFGEELLLGAAGRTTQGFNVTSDVTQKFTGQIRDQESGEDFFNARYFTAPLGRFNSPDPMNAGASLLSSQSWNGYAYALNNPLMFVDPTGLACLYIGQAGGNISDRSNYEDDDSGGQTCSDAFSAANNKAISATAYGAQDDVAAALEVDDAVNSWAGNQSKATIAYSTNDPFVKNFMKSSSMYAINLAIEQACKGSSNQGRISVGTYEAAANTFLDELSLATSSISEAQLGAFDAAFRFNRNLVNIQVTNTISLNSAAFHLFSGIGGILSGMGFKNAGQSVKNLGQLQGNQHFGNVTQVLNITRQNACDGPAPEIP